MPVQAIVDGDGHFRCPFCSTTVANERGLIGHVHRVHKNALITAPICAAFRAMVACLNYFPFYGVLLCLTQNIKRGSDLPYLTFESKLRAGKRQRATPLACTGLGGELADAFLGVVPNLGHGRIGFV